MKNITIKSGISSNWEKGNIFLVKQLPEMGAISIRITNEIKMFLKQNGAWKFIRLNEF